VFDQLVRDHQLDEANEDAAVSRESGGAGCPDRRLNHKTPYPYGLSEREVDELRFIGTGNSNQQIAYALYISLSTVAHHVTSILTKTDSSNRVEAATYASRQGLT